MIQNNVESKDIEQLMAEADELIRQINSDAVKDMKEEYRLQFRKHIQSLEKIKFGVRNGVKEKKSAKKGSGAEGMHEAIQDIVKAFQEMKTYFS